MKLCYWPT